MTLHIFIQIGISLFQHRKIHGCKFFPFPLLSKIITNTNFKLIKMWIYYKNLEKEGKLFNGQGVFFRNLHPLLHAYNRVLPIPGLVIYISFKKDLFFLTWSKLILQAKIEQLKVPTATSGCNKYDNNDSSGWWWTQGHSDPQEHTHQTSYYSS